jgi:hypothetical protein
MSKNIDTILFQSNRHRGWQHTCDLCYNCVGGCCDAAPISKFTLGLDEELLRLLFCDETCVINWIQRQERLRTQRVFASPALFK